jgi:hypothetical protein
MIQYGYIQNISQLHYISYLPQKVCMDMKSWPDAQRTALTFKNRASYM